MPTSKLLEPGYRAIGRFLAIAVLVFIAAYPPYVQSCHISLIRCTAVYLGFCTTALLMIALMGSYVLAVGAGFASLIDSLCKSDK